MEILQNSNLLDWLPEDVRRFLDGGGWWVVAIVGGLLVLGIADRLVRRLFTRRRAVRLDRDATLEENLSAYPPPPQVNGGRRLMVYHVPVRLRLAVFAPAGTETVIRTEDIIPLLDSLWPGMGELARQDHARLKPWPAQLSQSGFFNNFLRHVHFADSNANHPHWILVGGRAQIGRRNVLLGLALWAEQSVTLGPLALDPHQWLDVIRLKDH